MPKVVCLAKVLRERGKTEEGKEEVEKRERGREKSRGVPLGHYDYVTATFAAVEKNWHNSGINPGSALGTRLHTPTLRMQERMCG